jgi:hypothetical protein
MGLLWVEERPQVLRRHASALLLMLQLQLQLLLLQTIPGPPLLLDADPNLKL